MIFIYLFGFSYTAIQFKNLSEQFTGKIEMLQNNMLKQLQSIKQH